MPAHMLMRMSLCMAMSMHMSQAALLLGCQDQGIICTGWAVFVYFLNVLIQAGFIAIIAYGMLGKQIDADTAADYRCAFGCCPSH